MLKKLTAILLLLMGLQIVYISPASAGNCPGGQVTTSGRCPPPAPVNHTGTASPEFLAECTWLSFPVGTVAHPIVFFTKASDARCIGPKWYTTCPDCDAWLRGERGPVNGPAKNAVVALRLHDNMGGVSIPRDAAARIRGDAGWCDYGRTAPDQSHRFNERPW